MSGCTTPTAAEAPVVVALDDRDVEPRTPMKRLGSTRKLAAFTNIRLQLSEQTRVLETRAEAAAGVAGELSEYFRRRADLEHEYSRALDKLAKTSLARHKDHKHKREQWSSINAFACWQAALENTRALSRDHSALAELYGGPFASRLQRAADDVIRLHRKCKDIVQERHEELAASLAEASAAAKAHAAASHEWRSAALKLRAASEARAKAALDTNKQKKLKATDKELAKRRLRHSEARTKALRARAEYVLSLEAANATLERYFLDDIADIMMCMEVGYEAVVERVMSAAGAAEAARGEAVRALAGRLPPPAAPAAPPPPRAPALLPYRGAPPNEQDAEMSELIGPEEEFEGMSSSLTSELSVRVSQLEAAASRLREECRDQEQLLASTTQELVDMMIGSPLDVSNLFGANAVTPTFPPPDDDQPRKEHEDYYLAKFRSYMSLAGRATRLERRAGGARATLRGAPPPGPAPAPSPHPAPAFSAPLRDHLPRPLVSCVTLLARHGLKHQGIFRVSGSQVEMQSLRAAFERGEDPLAHVKDASDINTVCGLLKLYLRSIRPPLVPPSLAERLLKLAATPNHSGNAGGGAASEQEAVCRLREALGGLPRPHMLVLRYLTAFLSHLTEFSEQNMMDAWNLAICVGPTLMAARGEGGAQVTAQNLVNEVVKRIIIHHAEIFPQDVAPHALYNKYSIMEVSEAEGADEADGDGDGDGEGEDADSADAEGEGEGEGDHDVDGRDDLSLYADDDDEISEDGESGDWQEREHVTSHNGHHRPSSAEHQLPSAQVRESSPAPATPSTPSTSHCSRLAESTPDLVLDLPARDPADAFATNKDTLKKRPTHKHSNSEGSETKSEGESTPQTTETETQRQDEASSSPVPARNTARVAAKFAELTLTGGSLKPALAAKPALMRRPTPHPHARPAPQEPKTPPP